MNGLGWAHQVFAMHRTCRTLGAACRRISQSGEIVRHAFWSVILLPIQSSTTMQAWWLFLGPTVRQCSNKENSMTQIKSASHDASLGNFPSCATHVAVGLRFALPLSIENQSDSNIRSQIKLRTVYISLFTLMLNFWI
jgi:hypothetical protein